MCIQKHIHIKNYTKIRKNCIPGVFLSLALFKKYTISSKIQKEKWILVYRVRAMSHKAIYRQPVPGNLQEDMPFTFHCSHTLLVDRRTLLKKWPLCDKSGPVACTAVGYLQIASKSCLVWQGPKENKHYGSVVAKRLRASNSNSGVSDQQSVGSNAHPWHLCP